MEIRKNSKEGKKKKRMKMYMWMKGHDELKLYDQSKKPKKDRKLLRYTPS